MISVPKLSILILLACVIYVSGANIRKSTSDVVIERAKRQVPPETTPTYEDNHEEDDEDGDYEEDDEPEYDYESPINATSSEGEESEEGFDMYGAESESDKNSESVDRSDEDANGDDDEYYVEEEDNKEGVEERPVYGGDEQGQQNNVTNYRGEEGEDYQQPLNGTEETPGGNFEYGKRVEGTLATPMYGNVNLNSSETNPVYGVQQGADRFNDTEDTEGDEPGYGGLNPQGVEPVYTGVMPQGVGPMYGGVTPQGVEAGYGGVTPQGAQPEYGGVTPQGGQPEYGGVTPQGGQPEYGGVTPQGGQPEYGGVTPQGGQPVYEGVTPQGVGPMYGGITPQGLGAVNGSDGNKTAEQTEYGTGEGIQNELPLYGEGADIYTPQQPNTTDINNASTPTSTGQEVDVCSMAVSLDSICNLPESVHDYFGGDMSMAAVIEDLYSPSILETLRSYDCPSGTWCLPPEYFKMFATDYQSFYDGAFCTAEMQECVQIVLERQNGLCPGSDQVRIWNFMNGTLDLLCNQDFQEDINGLCFASAVETLFVLYQDVEAGDPVLSEHKQALAQNDCNDYLVGITKMYLCADETCTFSEQLLLSGFAEANLNSISDRAAAIKEQCNINVTCDAELVLDAELDYDDEYVDEYDDEYEYDEDEGGEEDDEYYTAEDEEEYLEEEEELLDEALEEVKEEEEEVEEEEEKNGLMNDIEGDSTSEGFIYGMVCLTIVVLLGFAAVGYITFRRSRVDRFYLYNRGYSKLDQDEETRMLANALN